MKYSTNILNLFPLLLILKVAYEFFCNAHRHSLILLHRLCAKGSLSLVPPRRRWLLFPGLVLFFLTAPILHAELPDGISYSLEVRSSPRAIRMHVLRIDLQAEGLKLHAEVGDKPEESEGNGVYVLTNPFHLAERADFLVAINSNPWSMVDGTTEYGEGRAAHRLGWIQVGNEIWSKPRNLGNFWIDKEGGAYIENITEPPEDAVLGIEGFHIILEKGNVIPPKREDASTAPRTSIGLDKTGQILTMLVVDGRMRGYSEGVTHHELAEIMKELGCYNALNLDGGGSSIMLKRTDKGISRLNSGIYGFLRPLPVIFGVVEAP